MSYSVKLSLAKKLSQALKTNIGPHNIDKLVKNLRLAPQFHGNSIHYSVPINNAESIGNISNINADSQVHIVDENIIFPLGKSEFITHVLSSGNIKSDCQANINSKEKVVVEFSSPNIAKPFHIGHFRGTVFGNFLANLNEYFASDVVRLNYLGDWGTPFGFLQIGLKALNIASKDLDENALDTLYRAYVKANDLAKGNPDIIKQANDIFEQLERRADFSHTRDWLDFRRVTVEEISVTYKRLGIHFNEYNWESDYSGGKIPDTLTLLKSLPQATSNEGHLVVPIGERNITLLKSNGTTMYLTRDIAAAIDRHNRYDFRKMFYVTDFSQENHFKDLHHILNLLGYSWHRKIEHVGYGKILGISTRQGSGVFLKSILDEARDKMYEKQKGTKTTRISLEDSKVSDILGMSSLIVYHLKTRRMKTATFQWEECLHMSGDGGVKLQYCHCRLVSLLQEAGLQPADHPDPEALQEPIALQLILDMARFHDVICLAHETCESSVVVKYLFKLSNTINKALKQLRVKGSEQHVAQQRLLLFERARQVLHEGLCVLGVTPLDKM